MIDNLSLVHWQEFAPWTNDTYIEQDLIISRALVEIYNHPLLKLSLHLEVVLLYKNVFIKLQLAIARI